MIKYDNHRTELLEKINHRQAAREEVMRAENKRVYRVVNALTDFILKVTSDPDATPAQLDAMARIAPVITNRYHQPYDPILSREEPRSNDLLLS